MNSPTADDYRTLAIVEAEPAHTQPTFPERKTGCPACGANQDTHSFSRGPHRHGFLWLRRCLVSVPHVHQHCHVYGDFPGTKGCGCTWTAATIPELKR